ncbi:MAG: synthase subunit delta [Bacteroidota bacterium]|jgi:F-type H+-transporting ATPase subunit delta
MSSVVSKYAEALLQLAVEKNVIERVYADMLCFGQVCAANKCLVTTLESPVVKHDKKLAVLQAIFQNEVHDLTLSFLAMVTQKHREALLPAMSQAFLAQYNQHQGIKIAQVTTTFPLSDQLTLQLQQIVQQIAPCQQVILEQNIDPAIIGGYVLRVEDKRMDQSLRKKLLTLEMNCVTEGY